MHLTDKEQGFLYEFTAKIGLLIFLRTKNIYNSSLLDNLIKKSIKLLFSLKDKDYRDFMLSIATFSSLQYFYVFKPIKFTSLNKLYWQDYLSTSIINLFDNTSLFEECIKLSDKFIKTFWNKKELDAIKSKKGKGEVYHTDLLMLSKNYTMVVFDYKNAITFKNLYSLVSRIYSSVVDKNILDELFFDSTNNENLFSFLRRKDKDFLKLKDLLTYTGALDENGKLAQSASYTVSFLEMFPLYKKNIELIYIKAFNGLSTRSFKFTKKNISILYDLGKIYKVLKKNISAEQENRILLNLFKDKFRENPEIIYNIIDVFELDKTDKVYTRKLIGGKDYEPLSLEVKKKHTKLIKESLFKNENIALLGNPGVGKTYSALDWASSRKRDDKPLIFIYASPRIAVNVDFLRKITDMYRNKERNYISFTSNSLMDTVEVTISEKVKQIFNLSEQTNTATSTKSLPQKGIFQTYKKMTTTGEKYYTYEVINKNNKNESIVQRTFKEAYNNIEKANQSELQKLDIFFGLTIQALKILERGLKNSDKKTTEFFLKLTKNRRVVFFLDEIIGTPEGVDLIRNLIRECDGRVEDVNWIIADASISNADVLHHLFTKEIEKFSIPRIILSSIFSKKGLYKEKTTIVGKEFTVINLNSYPAGSLTVEVYVHTDKKDQINFFANLLSSERKNKPILYLQNKEKVNRISKKLKDENNRVLVVTADIDKEHKDKAIVKANEGEYDYSLITSSSSRGVSYPYSKTIILDLQRFEIESGLAELVQAAYRARGSEKDNKIDRKLILVYRSYLEKENKENKYARRMAKLDALLHIYLALLSIYSRMGLKNINLTVTPIGELSNVKTETDNIGKLLQIMSYITSRPEYKQMEETDVIIKTYETLDILKTVSLRTFHSIKNNPLSYLNKVKNILYQVKDLNKLGNYLECIYKNSYLINGFLIPQKSSKAEMIQIAAKPDKITKFLSKLVASIEKKKAGGRATVNQEQIGIYAKSLLLSLKKHNDNEESFIIDSRTTHQVAVFMPTIFLNNVHLAESVQKIHKLFVRLESIANRSIGFGNAGFIAATVGLDGLTTGKFTKGVITQNSQQIIRPDVLVYIFDGKEENIYNNIEKEYRNDYFSKTLFSIML